MAGISRIGRIWTDENGGVVIDGWRVELDPGESFITVPASGQLEGDAPMFGGRWTLAELADLSITLGEGPTL